MSNAQPAQAAEQGMVQAGPDGGDTAPAAGGPAGSLLRQARERQGMTLEGLAQATKVSTDKLQALEAQDWKAMPDIAFNRSLVLAICRHLQVDAAPIMAQMPQAAIASLQPKGSLNEPVRHRGVPSVLAGNGSKLGRKLLTGLLALLVVAAALYAGAWLLKTYEDYAQQDGDDSAETTTLPTLMFAPQDESAELSGQNPVEPEPLTEALPQDGASPAASPSAANTVATPATPVEAAAPAATTPAVAVVAGQELPQLAPSAPIIGSEANAQSTTVAAGGETTLRLQAQGQTWVQVRGAKQQVLLEKIMQPNEVYETKAVRPLAVVIGQAHMAQVQVGGQDFDLAAVTRGNVARFELK